MMSGLDSANEARLMAIPGMIACGDHSGIPKCCIKFYVTEYIWLSDHEKALYITPAMVTFKFPGEYVPCRRCVAYGHLYPKIETMPCPDDIREKCEAAARAT